MDPSSSSHSTFIDDGHVRLVSTIGTGAYGVVYYALDSRPDASCPVPRAVKSLRKTGLDARQKHFQLREVALHRLACSHPSIVHMNRLVEEQDHVYMIMDYGDEGDLFSMIVEKQRYVGDDELIRSVFLQLIDGIAWMHALGIAHRDIKPENIVCSDDGRRVRICDFGLATSEITSSEFGCGSTFYIAPECIGDWFPDRKTYATRTGDIWSLGVILVNLVCGRNPWRIADLTDESFTQYVLDNTFLRRTLPITAQCYDLLNRIFTLEPSQRITLQELRKAVCEIQSFSMGEEELVATHLQAKANVVAEDKWEQGVDAADVYEDEFLGTTPSLRADSGSPSPLVYRSRAASLSDSLSLPPTPFLSSVDVTTPYPWHTPANALESPPKPVVFDTTPSLLDVEMAGVRDSLRTPDLI